MSDTAYEDLKREYDGVCERREFWKTRCEQLEAALRDIRPHLPALICYASTISEHLPNGFPARVDALLGSPSSDGTEP